MLFKNKLARVFRNYFLLFAPIIALSSLFFAVPPAMASGETVTITDPVNGVVEFANTYNLSCVGSNLGWSYAQTRLVDDQDNERFAYATTTTGCSISGGNVILTFPYDFTTHSSDTGHYTINYTYRDPRVYDDNRTYTASFNYDQTLSIPGAPTNLTAISSTPYPSISWTASTGAPASYNIYRNGTLIDVVSPITTTLQDTEAPYGTSTYYVTAVNAAGESSPSNSVSINFLYGRETSPETVTITDPVHGVVEFANTYNLSCVGANLGFNGRTTSLNDGKDGGNTTFATSTGCSISGSNVILTFGYDFTTHTSDTGHYYVRYAFRDPNVYDDPWTNTAQFAPPTPVVQINSGGDTQGSFITDTDVSGGSTYTSSNSVDTSNVTYPAPEAVYQSVRYGNMTYTIPSLTPNTNYLVRLHFNELYWGTSNSGNAGGAGSRVFNVAINGSQVLNHFDIFLTAGGADKALVKEFNATADANGNIAIDFSNVTDNAMVNAIEIDTPGSVGAPQVGSLSLNAGGIGSGSFQPDDDYSGGTIYSTTASVDTSGVTNPAPQSVYQTSRYGNMSYNIPNLIPNASYTVKLHFNELYWGTSLSGGSGGNGSRVFNVALNGTNVLNNFDIYQTAGGANKAVVESFTTNADSNGKITIDFTGVTDNPLVNGIELSH